ncbi:MAG: TRAP transporter large permease subunit [Treponema sp.]|jgi:tripartite ATP-independent transporter DctM subunit|nr:TRAP transporter large permease subunit [Treponema sp.]
METKTSLAQKILTRAEEGICFGALSLLALIPFVEFVLHQFRLVIPATRDLMPQLFLITGFFAGMLTAKLGEHISITAVQYIKSEKIKRTLEFITSLLSVFVLTVLAWNCVSFIKYNMWKSVGPISESVFAVSMPLGYAVIALRYAVRKRTAKEIIIMAAAFLLGIAAALPAITKIIWGEPPEPFYSWVNNLYDLAAFTRLPAILFLILAAFFGMPIFAAIGGIALVMLQAAGMEPDAAPLHIHSALIETDIIAIPLFTLTGFFLSESKAGERLVRTFRCFFGWMPGGMVVASVLICAFFTSFTGASGVTILALGGILHLILIENKYKENSSIGLLTSVGGIGLMFPPSLPIILVASTSNTILHFMNVPTTYNIIHYFVGALIPGILLILAMIAIGVVNSFRDKMPTEAFNSKEALPSLKESFLEILLPVILMLGYFSGRLTLLEVSAFSVVYIAVVEVFIRKDIAVKDIPKVFAKAVPIIGGVLAILAMAKALSYPIIVVSNVPEQFASWMQATISSKYVFLLLLNLSLLVVGCLMDIFSAIFVVLPLIVPLGFAYGIDPVHLGIIFIMNLEVGFLTPPVGLNLFLASYRFEKPFVKICHYVLPYLIIQLVVVLLVTYVPWLSTGLIQIIGNK